MLSKLASALDAPASENLRRLEHAVALYVAYRVAKGLISAGPSGIKKAIVGSVLSVTRVVPALNAKVQEEEDAMFADIEREHLKILPDPDAHTSLPVSGIPADELIAQCRALRSKETEFLQGHAHGGIYYSDAADLARVHKEVTGLFLSSNLLFPGVFVSTRKFEAEIVRMLVSMLGGDAVGACGTLTSGGTESILLAVKSYRDWAKASRGIESPEVLAANTAHPALDKACHYLGVKLVKVPVTAATAYKFTAAVASPHLTRNTVMVYASAPTFSHGVVDDVQGLSELTLPRSIGLHVDNCLGGFLLSHLQAIGDFTPGFDFKVPGVTSISVDVHKFGCSPKGVSSVLYRTPELRRYQYHSTVDFAGGLYTTPTMQGSRSGAVVAAAWATMLHIGAAGYTEKARQYAAVTKRLVSGLSGMPGVQLLGHADAAIVSFTSDKYDIYALVDRVSKKGWELAGIQAPPGAAIRLGERMLRDVDALLADIQEAAEYCTAHPSEPAKGVVAAMYGNNTLLPAHEMEAALSKYLDLLFKVVPA